MTKATKESWKTKSAPKKKVRLGYESLFSELDAEKLLKGLIPVDMEDKWFIYYEDGWLYLHRSWTGALIYWIKLDVSPTGVRVVDSWVNRDPNEYKEIDIEYDRQMLDFLIRRILLSEEVDFPIRKKDQKTTPIGIYQHHSSGRAFPETEFKNSSLIDRIHGIFKRKTKENAEQKH